MNSDFVDAATAQELVDTGKYMILSTNGPDGFPHTSPVFYMFGPADQFYWLSTTHAQHSQNIMRDGKVSGVIMDTTHEQGTGYALYSKAQAEMFHKPENNTKWGNDYHFGHAVRAFCASSRTLQDKTDIILAPSSPRKIFRLRVLETSINGGEYDASSGLWLDARKPVTIAPAMNARGIGPLQITG